MDEILAALESLKYHGSFYSDRKIAPKFLDIKFNKIGNISFPLEDNKIEEIITIAEPAKFGWKDKTILDESVRKVWEVKKTKFRIAKKLWDKGFKPLLEKIKIDLGLPKSSRLKADLHNMLIYEKDNFFKPHQDSEKEDNMVATMVVVLPTKHKGGELIIDHKGEKKILKGAGVLKNISCFSFYADCFHEVKEVTDGYRVSLTFNLILENYKGSVGSLYEKDFYSRLYNAFERYFFNKNNVVDKYDSNSADKIIYLLDHQYTQNGLEWDKLKNSDRRRVEVMLKIADELGLTAHLSLVDFKEIWDCEYDDYRYKYRRDYEDDDNEEDTEEEEGTPMDIIVEEATLNYWVNRESKHVNYKDYTVSGNCIRWTQSNSIYNPHKSEYEGWMGNYGNTLERWYHRAAIILWCKEDDNSVLFEMDSEKFVEEVFLLMEEKKNYEKVVAMLSNASQYWSRYSNNHKTISDYKRVINLAIYLNNKKISKDILEGYNVSIINTDTASLLCGLIGLYGDEWAIELLEIITKDTGFYNKNYIDKYSEIIAIILKSNLDTSVIDWLFNYQFKITEERHKSESENAFLLKKDAKERYLEIEELILATVYSQNNKQHSNIINNIKKNQYLYDPILLIGIFNIYIKHLDGKNLKLFNCKEFYEYIYKLLEEEKKEGLRSVGDWSIDTKLNDSDENIRKLHEFLKNSNEQQKVWPLVESERNRMSSKIRNLYIPVKEKIDKGGRPYKLILTKTDELHKESKKRYNNLLGAIEDLKSVKL